MNRKLLEQPFPEELLKTRKGTFGKPFTYVEGAEYIRRLNDAFEGDWSFEVVEHHNLNTEVVVLGKLLASGVTKMAFGGSSITTNRDTGEVISLADDLKSAATDALKKASSLLGVGLHLYSEPASETKRGSNGNGHRANAHRGNGNGRSKGNGNSNGHRQHQRSNNSNNGNRLTQKQLSCIWGMARSLGRSVDQVRDFTLQTYNAQPEQMSKTDASAFITELGEALSQAGGQA